MKNLPLLFFIINLIFVSCTDVVNEVPLENVLEHRNFISSKTGDEKELLNEYKHLFDNSVSNKSKPYIYYYLSRLETNKYYLNLGLSKFPEDPYLRLNKKKYINSPYEERALYKDILRKHPKFGVALYNLLLSGEFKTLVSGETISDSFLKRNIQSIKELKKIFDGYLNGENYSKFYDFNDIKKYGDPEVDLFIKEKMIAFEPIYERLLMEYKIPDYFLKKKIHTSSQWCENYILLNEKMEFKLVDYGPRILNVRDSLVIRGKFLPTGGIEFYSENSKYLNNGVQKTMLPEFKIYKDSEPTLSQINLSFELIDGKGNTQNLVERKIRNHRYSESTYMLKFSPCKDYKESSYGGPKLDRYGNWISQDPPPPPTFEIIEIVEDEEEVEETIIESTETTQEEIIEDVEVLDDFDVDVPFAIIEDVPIFPGCERVAKDKRRDCFQEKIQRHINRNFRYPEIAQEMGIQGRVYVQFVIAKNGDIVGIRSRGPDKNLEKEAQRIIGKLPKMIPGKQKGRPVRVPFSIPITFRLQ